MAQARKNWIEGNCPWARYKKPQAAALAPIPELEMWSRQEVIKA